MIVDIGLIDITGMIGIRTVGTTEDIVHLYRRTLGHIHYGPTGNALSIAAAINILDVTAKKVDDSRGLVIVRGVTRQIYVYTDTTALAASEDDCALVSLHALWDVDEDVAAVLHLVLLFLTEVSLSCSVYLAYRIILAVTT